MGKLNANCMGDRMFSYIYIVVYILEEMVYVG
jgi:hypothetical protein